MKAMIAWLAVISSFVCLAAVGEAPEQTTTLRFKDDGTFKIVQFADVHWTYGFREDRQSGKLMRAVLDAEKPDLVVYTGDNITGATILPTRALRQVTAPCAERQIPWAAVFGNHDDEGSSSRKRQMEIMRTLPYCMASAGPEGVEGVSNYILTIGASKAPDSPAARLYFFDSLGYMIYQGEKKYNYIQESQLNWYKQESARLRESAGGALLPSLAFFHIPIPEYRVAWESGRVAGVQQEGVADSPVNSGLFDLLKETGEVMGVFVGHDHVNDYIGLVDGIYLGYGRGTGYSTYGREGFPRGGRVIELVEGERKLRTWHRLETGEQEMQIP